MARKDASACTSLRAVGSLLDSLYAAGGRRALFLLDAESAHHMGALALGALHRSPALRRLAAAPQRPALEVEALGERFASPVGVAAGFDKSGALYNGLGAFGFGFVEVGTVTALAQPGNPRPRLFRLPLDRALLNRMGFNNPGAAAVAEALRAYPADNIVLGVNIGKSKVTPLDEAPADYATSARALAPFADYMVVNVSSPNTPGLRSLQSVEALAPVLTAVQAELARTPRRVPLLVKIAPDLADEDVDAVADLARALGLSGIVATNTTVRRDGLVTSPSAVESMGAGGLSGSPLRARALEVIARLYRRAEGVLTIIGAGGIATAEHAWEAITAGATLVQVYTAFVYGGPDLPREIARGLEARLAASGHARLADVVGSAA
jgi:dihydroorotate dehydrogenase